MATIPDRARYRRILSLPALAAMVLPLMVLACLAAAPAAAQQKLRKDYALIFGTVFGPDGRARYGVPVKIRRADKKKAFWEGYSDHAGEFAVRVPPGTADYVIWADIKVPKGEPKPETKVHVENNERVDVSLHLKQ